MLRVVIYEGKKVVFSSKSWRADRADKIYIDKLIKVLCLFLWTAIIDFRGLSLLTTVTHKAVWLVNIVNIKSFEILSKGA